MKNEEKSIGGLDKILQDKDERVEKLIRDLVDLALINNQVISECSFGLETTAKVQLAVEMNNEVLRTFTSIENDEKEEESKES